MKTVSRNPAPRTTDELHFVYHSSFEDGDAAFKADKPLDTPTSDRFMPDDVTRGLARHMHYAAWRASKATTNWQQAHWRRIHNETRNRIVVGNRKLVYRAVQKWMPSSLAADDLAAECQIVLLKAVAAFNPWMGIRFSTYAFTCLMRALSRLMRRHLADRLAHARPLESLVSGEPSCREFEEPSDPRLEQLGELIGDNATVLTAREKLVIRRRYHLNDGGKETQTLEQLGHDLGLSKERVRQVQQAALQKLREALVAVEPIA